ncbi:hypothetical protein SI65_04234 [Aspergillus cristatus]|uniref:Uncharacterized protein n=1 Tax=Aspergillus cristatus TaxID=573508 RepID=A0A1E3BK75_ASPCR|nr:hypothetical protein SI65_04234 [Aspergillus cristatus]
MVAVKIKRANIICATSLKSSFPDITVQDTVQVGQSVGRRDNEGDCGTVGGWVDKKTAQWCTFGLTCSHVALPDDVPAIQTFRNNGVSFTDNSSAPCLQMDSPSERDLKSQLREYDRRINNLTGYIEYEKVKRKIEHGESSILPYEQRLYDRFTAMITPIEQKKLELELFRADHKSNKLPVNGPGNSSLHNEGPSPELQQQRMLYKCGRATGYTEGRCSGIKHARIVNQIFNGQETRRITYEHTVPGCQDQRFSLPGDTGAFAVTMHLRVVGMVVASMELGSITFITHVNDLFADIETRTGAGMVRVMGGGSGFGAAIARRFGEEGAKVVITDINAEGGQNVASQNPSSLIFQKQDVTNPEDWKTVINLAFEKFGRLDVLVNNAGTTYRNKPTLEVTEEEWERVFKVNVKGIFHGSQAFVQRVIEQGQGGSMINISSTGASRPRPGLVWYNASKGAVSNATKGLAAEYGPHNIRVNTVCPLLSGTGLFSMFTGLEDTPENREKFLGNVPLGRLTEADDVANMCLYLASDEGRFINGTELVVDGGKCI